MDIFKFLSWNTVRNSKPIEEIMNSDSYILATLTDYLHGVSQLGLQYKGSNNGFYDYIVRNRKIQK